MAGLRFKLLVLLAACTLWLPAEAQLHRGARTLVRGGQFEKPDSLQRQRDSLRVAEIARQIDSMARADYAADSAAVASLRTDDLHLLDSLAEARFAAARQGIDTTTRRPAPRKRWFMSDSMSLSKVCWLSTVLPGYGQVYNKQYWKLPILYGTVGTGLALFINENRKFKPLKRAYDAYTDVSLSRTPELDALQTKMIRSNTRRQLYLGITIASYIYFIGDAAVNYSTNDVSNVKKAYNLLADYEQHPDKYPNGPTDEFQGRYSASYIKNMRDNFRRNRDLCIIISGALYALQIIDAHVDAHLKDYDISDDLTMNLEPLVDYPYIPSMNANRPVFGFNMSLKF